MFLKISSLYDSHVHWLGTGQIESGLKLFHLRSPEDVATLDIKPSYFRQEWLIGFGWDQNLWPSTTLPTKAILDRYFPQNPVFFQRGDGHCSWLNSLALQRLGYDSSHSGILFEDDHFKAYSSLPTQADEQLRESLKTATRMFNEAGFTHIRDMTCNEQQWNQAVSLDNDGELSLYVQENFLCERPQDLESVLSQARKARGQQTKHVTVQGIKIFFDGTLGSDTAYLSKCTCSSLKSAWGLTDIENLISRCWSDGFEVAIHTIGDEAAHQVVSIARKIMATNKITGWLNLEHVEVLRPETLQMLKALHVRCHMQPCHWLSDRLWLQEKLGDLYKCAFPWGPISRSRIPLHFGSDSPVARISFWDNKKALSESVNFDIQELKGEILDYHCFFPPAAGTYSIFEDNNLKELHFDGVRII